jgi:hypothetical protein
VVDGIQPGESNCIVCATGDTETGIEIQGEAAAVVRKIHRFGVPMEEADKFVRTYGTNTYRSNEEGQPEPVVTIQILLCPECAAKTETLIGPLENIPCMEIWVDRLPAPPFGC